jgi:hypothetical protein
VPGSTESARQDHDGGGVPGRDVAAQPRLGLIRPARCIETLVELQPDEVREMVIRFCCSDQPPFGFLGVVGLVEARCEPLHGGGVAGVRGPGVTGWFAYRRVGADCSTATALRVHSTT